MVKQVCLPRSDRVVPSKTSCPAKRRPYRNISNGSDERFFLTGAALRSANVLNGERSTKWSASPDLVQRLNGVRLER